MTLRVSFDLEAISSIRMGKLLMDHLNDTGFLAKVSALIGAEAATQAPPPVNPTPVVAETAVIPAADARAAEAELIAEATKRTRRTKAEMAAAAAEKAAADKAAAETVAEETTTEAETVAEETTTEAETVVVDEPKTAPVLVEAPAADSEDELMKALMGETAAPAAASGNPGEKYAGLDSAALRAEIANRMRRPGHGIQWMKGHIEEAMKTDKKADTVGKFKDEQLISMLVHSDTLAA